MPAVGWLTRTPADVPADDGWLSEREREVLSHLRLPKRRDDWRLGRWTAKAAIAAWNGAAPEAVEVSAAEDGAPEAVIAGQPAAITVSLSHRAGRGLAAVTDAPTRLGCDLEALEPRSPAFVREWLAAAERALVAEFAGEPRDLAANLLWVAKEAAAKARREGLRLNVRRATVDPGRIDGSSGGWKRLRVSWEDGPVELGWWRGEPGWVMAVVCDPFSEAPPTDLG